MPFLVWNTIGGKKCLVVRWNRRLNGKPRVVKEICIGSIENLAMMIQNPQHSVDAYPLSFGAAAFVMMMEREIELRNIINDLIPHDNKVL